MIDIYRSARRSGGRKCAHCSGSGVIGAAVIESVKVRLICDTCQRPSSRIAQGTDPESVRDSLRPRDIPDGWRVRQRVHTCPECVALESGTPSETSPTTPGEGEPSAAPPRIRKERANG